MSERFRQQIAGSGLLESAALLRVTSREIRAVSGDIAAAVRPVTMEYKSMGAIVSGELANLAAAARKFHQVTCYIDYITYLQFNYHVMMRHSRQIARWLHHQLVLDIRLETIKSLPRLATAPSSAIAG